jgi:hypothetical protein
LPRDVDVLVVGTTARRVLAEIGSAAEQQLHREVNVTRVSGSDWDEGSTAFIRTVRAQAVATIPLELD